MIKLKKIPAPFEIVSSVLGALYAWRDASEYSFPSYIMGLALTGISTKILKNTFKLKSPGGGRYSFPSGQIAVAAFSACFSWLGSREESSGQTVVDSLTQKSLSAIMLALAGVTFASRLSKGNKEYPACYLLDGIAGAALGITYAFTAKKVLPKACEKAVEAANSIKQRLGWQS